MPWAIIACALLQPNPTDRPVEPIYASREARQAVARSRFAYQRLKSLSYDYEGSAGTCRVWWTATAFRQSSKEVDWAYENGVLIVRERNNWYAGRCGRKLVAGKLAKARISVEPMLLKLATNRNPASEIFSVDKTVRVLGAGKLEGERTTMLEASNKLLRVAATVRNRDGLLVGTLQSSLDVRGRVVATSQQRYHYRSVNEAFGPSALKLTPPGQPRSLDALAP